MNKQIRIGYDIACPEFTTEKRSWKERLFSLPWKPWVKYKLTDHPLVYVIENETHINYICGLNTYLKITNEKKESYTNSR